MNTTTRRIECSECGKPLAISATRGTSTMPSYDATDGSECPSGVGHLPQEAQAFCRWCDEPIRWSNAYDEPHYVHVTSLATIHCPGLGAGKDVTPA